MKKIKYSHHKNKIYIFSLFVTVCLLCGCTSKNNRQLLMCEKLGFDIVNKDTFLVTASFTVYENQEKSNMTKSFEAKDENEALKALLSISEDVMYKPTNQLFIGKSMDENSKIKLLSALMNSSDFQLKCRVFDCENAFSLIYGNIETGEDGGLSFQEYYRKNTSLSGKEF